MLTPSALGPSFGTNEEVLVISKAANPVQIDGVWSTETEWLDASETKIVADGLTAYLRVKYDERFLYILIDFVSDQGLDRSRDLAVACFDTKSDDGNVPLEDDYCFYAATRTGRTTSGIMQGSGSGWVIIQDAKLVDRFARIGYSHSSPYDDKNGHVSYELKIPTGPYGLEEEMRFYLYVSDGYHNNFVEWPANSGGKQFAIGSPTIKDVLAIPDGWGKLHLKPS